MSTAQNIKKTKKNQTSNSNADASQQPRQGGSSRRLRDAKSADKPEKSVHDVPKSATPEWPSTKLL